MAQQHSLKRKRLSYNLPAPDEQLEALALPPANFPRHFDPRPLLFSASTGERIHNRPTPRDAKPRFGEAHPKHCLGVSALALDVSTVVLPSHASSSHSPHYEDDSIESRKPTGILYSAGRDGLMAAWELGLPTKRRRQRSGANLQIKRARQKRLTDLGAYRDGESSLEDDDGFSSPADSDGSDTDSFDTESRHGHTDRSSKEARRKSGIQSIPYEDKWQIDQAQLNDTQPAPRATFRQSVQPHSDWINDIVLCNMNRTVISASSDQTIRAWNPHESQSSMQPALLGTHDDFVKCLAHSRQGNWVASGGFDRKIKVWDIEQTRDKPIVEMPLLSEQDSIYSLATNPRGSFLASGSPSKIVRLWDLRQQQPEIARLRGHADNIRALLVSEDGKVVLSASTDATIKLWSTSMQRCLHTFTYHTESVWSLFSNHPDLDIFYSGDRSGLVCKVDLEGCGDMSEGECVLLCKDDDTSTSSGSYGLSEGINSIVATDDAFLWTTTGSSSILRWKDIPPRRQRQTPARPALRNPVNSLLGTSFSHQPLLQVEEQPSPLPTTTDRRGVSFAPDLDDSDADSLHVSPHPNIPMASPSGAATHMRRPSSIKQNSLNQVQPLSPRDPALDNQIDGVPLESLVCFALGMAYSSPFSPQAVMQRQQYAESLASLTSAVHRWPHTPHSQNSFGLSRLSSRNFDSKEEPAQVPPSSAMLAYTHRESASDAVPLRLTPEEVIWGRKGLIRCEQLNDRRTVLTADTAGDIAAWDIITCRCLGIFSRQELSSLQPPQSDRASTAARGREVKELLEMVRIMVEGEGITQAWASVDVRVGSLTVHLDEGRCFGAEIYCDDADLNTTAQVEIARINPGKVMLRNIFDKFVSSSVSQNALNTTVETPRGQRQSPPSHIVIPKATVPMPLDLNLLSASRKGATTAGIALATPATTSVLPPSSTDLSKRATDASLANVRADLPSSRPGTPNTDTGDYFANVSSDAPASPTLTKNTPNRFMGKLKGLGRSNMKKGSSTDAVDGQAGSAAQKEVAKDGSTELDAQLRTVRGLMARPLQVPSLSEVPVLADFPTNLVYSVSEQAKSSDVWTVIYRGLAGTTDGDEAQVMAVAPLWILEYLLAGRVPAVEPLKITFLLQPWSQGGDDDLPEMPESHARLTANRVLRISKVAAFVVDKLDHFHQPVGSSPAELSRNVSHTSLASYSSTQSGGSTLKPMYMNRSPEDIVELICNNIVLPHRATLAAVRQYCFKKSGDLVLLYRLKQSV